MFSLIVRTPFVVDSNHTHGEVSIQHYIIKLVSELRQVDEYLQILLFPPSIKWPPRYGWNIDASGVKHHNRTQYAITMFITYVSKLLTINMLSRFNVWQENFEDTKWELRLVQLHKNRKYNSQEKADTTLIRKLWQSYDPDNVLVLIALHQS